MHHESAVGHSHDLFHLARDKQHRHSLPGKLLHQKIDLFLGPDVDSPCRLVEQKHLGLQGQPLREDNLLLVTTRKKSRQLPRSRRLDAESFGHFFDQLFFALLIYKESLRLAAQRDQGHVFLHRHFNDEPLPFSILGHQGKSTTQSLPW